MNILPAISVGTPRGANVSKITWRGGGIVQYSDWPEGAEVCLFTTAWRTALGPTRPPVRWVRCVLPPEVMWPARDAGN